MREHSPLSGQNMQIAKQNLLIAFLQKALKEYKRLLDESRKGKPLKIVEISFLSDYPGETKFLIQVRNKNCVIELSAAEIFSEKYNLDDFNEFNASMIKAAAQGDLRNFLKIKPNNPEYKIVSKSVDRKKGQNLFTIKSTSGKNFVAAAKEVAAMREVINKLSPDDIYDIAYTRGYETAISEAVLPITYGF